MANLKYSRRGGSITGCIAIAFLLLSCEERPTEIVPEPQTKVGEVISACGQWFQKPNTAVAVVDVLLRIPAYAPEYFSGPFPDHEAAIINSGGTILHRFRVPVRRISIPTDSISILEQRYIVMYTRAVPDITRTDAIVVINNKAQPSESEIATMRKLGVRFLQSFPFGHVEAPDTAIPHLRALDFVNYVAPEEAACV